jgi:predicted DNA-binding ribbon-helix-helix protein
MEKVSVNIDGHQTSFSLEVEFLEALRAIAKNESKSLKKLVSEIDASRGGRNLSSAIRVFILKNLA